MNIIEIDNNWLSQAVSKKNDDELAILFSEIAEFHKVGVLPAHSALRTLSGELEREKSIPSATFLRQTEDAVLYEMARRYYNSLVVGLIIKGDDAQ